MTLANQTIDRVQSDPQSYTRRRATMRRPHRRALLFVDVAAALLGALALAIVAFAAEAPAAILGSFGALTTLGMINAVGSYSSRELRRPRRWPPLMALSVALVLNALVMVILLSRGLEQAPLLLLTAAAGPLLVAMTDLACRLIIRAAIRPVILVVGEDTETSEQPDHLSSARVVQLQIPGNVRMNPELLVDLVSERAVLCGADVIELQTSHPLAGEVVRDLSWVLRRENISLRLVLSGPVLSHRRAKMKVRGGDILVDVAAPRPRTLDRSGKNVLDVLGAGILTVIFSPVLLVLAVLVKTGSKGPVFYRQVRIGRDGEPFEILKFRSMVVDADAHLARLLADQGRGNSPLFKLENDPRVTALGATMRRYSLDELPQLFNVLGRSMSLVGPRPQVPAEVALYDGPASQRLGVRPGMTGMWQVGGRSRLTWNQALDLDLRYVHNWSVGQDLRILALTFRAVVGGDGAQ